jgi:hypothetical protein
MKTYPKHEAKCVCQGGLNISWELGWGAAGWRVEGGILDLKIELFKVVSILPIVRESF